MPIVLRSSLISEDVHVSLVVVWNHGPLMPLGGIWSHLVSLLLVLAQSVDLVWLRSVWHELLVAVVESSRVLRTAVILLIERVGVDPLELEAIVLVLVQDALQAVNQVLMVFVAIENIET